MLKMVTRGLKFAGKVTHRLAVHLDAVLIREGEKI